jgi:hypothetical protein
MISGLAEELSAEMTEPARKRTERSPARQAEKRESVAAAQRAPRKRVLRLFRDILAAPLLEGVQRAISDKGLPHPDPYSILQDINFK